MELSLEKHGKEFSAGDDDDQASPRGILEIPVSGTDSDHSGSSSSSFSSSSPEKSSEVERVNVREGLGQPWKSMLESFKKKSAQRISAISLFAASYQMSKKSLRKRRMERLRSAEEGINMGVIPTKPSWRNFDYAELQDATDNFNPGNNTTITFSLSLYRHGFLLVRSKKPVYSASAFEKLGLPIEYPSSQSNHTI